MTDGAQARAHKARISADPVDAWRAERPDRRARADEHRAVRMGSAAPFRGGQLPCSATGSRIIRLAAAARRRQAAPCHRDLVPGTDKQLHSKAATVSLTGRRGFGLARRERDRGDRAGRRGDAVGVRRCGGLDRKLLPAGEVIRFSAAQAQRAGSGHQVDGRGGAELCDGDGSLLGNWALVGKSRGPGLNALDVLAQEAHHKVA